MKELQEIIETLKRLEKSSQPAATATLVKVEGSAYRQPGARMLITDEEEVIGAISGGCLERDIWERAQLVIRDSKSQLVKYDTTSEEDILWGLGLGCQGVAHVLIEPLHSLNSLSFSLIEQCFQERTWGAIATIFRVEGKLEVNTDDRLLLGAETIINHISDEELATKIFNDTSTALQQKCSLVKTYQHTKGTVEVFIEIIEPPISLIVFGAGYDTLPLVSFAKQLGWQVTVVDSRQREATKARLALADFVWLDSAEQIVEKLTIDSRQAVVIMNHNYLNDLEVLKVLANFQLPYLGILGPKKRTARLIDELTEAQVTLAAQQQSCFYSPVGLDIGANTCQEVALSIIAEIQTVMSGCQGEFLRNRNGSIHGRNEQ
ncbi:MAG: XdhC family protein [Waterburya sp.]